MRSLSPGAPRRRRCPPFFAGTALLLLVLSGSASAAPVAPPSGSGEGRATPAGLFLRASAGTTWVRVHEVGQSPCDVADTVGSNPGQSLEHVWCFAAGDTTWPAGPAGAGWDHWSRYDPPVPAASRWHVTQSHGGPATGGWNAWAGCDSAGTNPACTDAAFWVFQDGYGNDWNYALALDMSSLDASVGGTLEFDLRYDAECNYDYLYLEYLRTSTGTWEAVRDSLNQPAVFNAVSGNLDGASGGFGRSCGGDYFGHGDQDQFSQPVYGNSIWLEDVRFVVPAQAGGMQLRWRAYSDGAWSDADGRGDTDGLAAIDNVTVTLGGSVVTDDFETGDFSGPVVTGPVPARGTVTWQPGSLLGNPYDGWALQFDPNYRNKGNTCEFSEFWMWAAKPLVGPIPANGFDFFLVTPSFDVAGWTGGVIEFAEYHYTPYERNDALGHATRTWSAGSGWSPWTDYDSVFPGFEGGCWTMNRRFDFSDRLGPDADSLQFAWHLTDLSEPGDFSWGNHNAVQVLVDNVSIGSYPAGGPVLQVRAIDLLRDTFSRSDPAHTAFLGNADEGQWPARAFLSEDSLNVYVGAANGVTAANVTLSWRVGTGTPPVFGAWNVKPLHLAVPDPFSATDEGRYRSTIGNDGSEDWSGAAGDGLIWEAGTTVEYVVRAVDDLANEATLEREFSVLPFDRTSGSQDGLFFLLVNDQPLDRKLLDLDASAGFDPVGGAGWGSFSQPAFVEPIVFLEQALAWYNGANVGDRYDVAGSGSSLEVEPRGAPLPAAGVGGFLEPDGTPHYAAIFWVAGAGATISDDAVRAELRTYLDAGGRLIVLGDDAAWLLEFQEGDGAFLAEYLGASIGVGDDHTGLRVLQAIGQPGTSLSERIVRIYGECPTQRGFDRLVLASPPNAVASVILAYTGGTPADEGRPAMIVTSRPGGGGTILGGFGGTALWDGRRELSCLLATVMRYELGLPVDPCDPPLDVLPGTPPPATFHLSRAAPSPFRGATVLDLLLPEARDVVAAVYDVTGRRVATIAEGRRPAGAHRLTWNGHVEGGGQAPAGVYFVRVIAGPDRVTRKVVRLH